MKEKVKKHLEKRHDADPSFDPATLPRPVIDALDALADQIDNVDALGKALMDAQNLTDKTKICAVH
jgi:hypothetical protein